MFENFETLLTEALITEAVEERKIIDAINGRYQVVINYIGSDGRAQGKRQIEIYAYGLSKAGNPVIRAFQPYGDTKSKVPSWKMFRLDRISSFRMLKRMFNSFEKEPNKRNFSSAENFNSNGDNSMTKVYKMVNFNDTPDKNIKPTKVKQAKSLTKPKQEKIFPEKELNKIPGPLPNKQIKQTDIEAFKQNLDKNLNIQKEKDEITKEMEIDNNDLKNGPKETTIEK